MNDLTTELANRVMVLHDKSKRFITKKQEDALFVMTGTLAKGIKINGEYFAFSSIAKIVDLDKYYEDHPEERPHYEPLRDMSVLGNRETYVGLDEEIFASKVRSSSAARDLLAFITEAEGRGEQVIHARAILEAWNKKKTAPEKTKSYWQTVYDKYYGKSLSPSEQAHFAHAVQKLSEDMPF